MRQSSLLGHVQELLGTIQSSGKPADALIDIFFRSKKYLGARDRRFIAETTYGTLRHLRLVQALVDRATDRIELFPQDRLLLLAVAYLAAVEKKDIPDLREVRQTLKGGKIGESLDAVIAGFAAPLQQSKDRVERIGVEFSFPDWLVKRLLEEYREAEVVRLCSSLNEPAPLTIRVNTIQVTREACQLDLRQQEIETDAARFSSDALHLRKRTNVFVLESFRNGWFEVQDEGSQLLVQLLDPKPTDKVLDACAGAGGKTLALSAWMKNRGEITAADVHTGRLEELKKRSRRAGAQNIRVRPVQTLADCAADRSDYFDLVLVDAPCSGLGTIRRNPGMKWSVTEATVQEIAERQRTIMNQAAVLVKPGGRLAYATCTLLRQENEEIVQGFLTAHPTFHSVQPRGSVEGVVPEVDGTVRLLPSVHGTDGFFLMILERGRGG